MDSRPIGVFDSGVGGLSILKELHKLLPNENYIFFADQAYIPYGEKTPRQLKNRVIKIAKFLTGQNIKALVMACNTATCYTLGTLRDNFSIPIIGTVPAIKPAVKNSKTKVVAVLATPATSRSRYLKDLIARHAQDAKVIIISCKYLENKVELGELDSMKTADLLSKYLGLLKKSGADQIVLGCTHYPFLKKHIQKLAGSRVRLIDSGQAIAKRVKNILAKALSGSLQIGKTIYLTSGNNHRFSRTASKLLNHRIKATSVDL
jgi:glutamate racemase